MQLAIFYPIAAAKWRKTINTPQYRVIFRPAANRLVPGVEGENGSISPRQKKTTGWRIEKYLPTAELALIHS